MAVLVGLIGGEKVLRNEILEIGRKAIRGVW